MTDTGYAPPPLPAARDLHEHARASRKGSSVPEAFSVARQRHEEAAAVERERRAEMQALIREAYDLGVALSVLARWSGYSYRSVQKIVGLP